MMDRTDSPMTSGMGDVERGSTNGIEFTTRRADSTFMNNESSDGPSNVSGDVETIQQAADKASMSEKDGLEHIYQQEREGAKTEGSKPGPAFIPIGKDDFDEDIYARCDAKFNKRLDKQNYITYGDEGTVHSVSTIDKDHPLDDTHRYGDRAIALILNAAYDKGNVHVKKSRLRDLGDNFDSKGNIPRTRRPIGKPAVIEVQGKAYFLAYAGKIALWGKAFQLKQQLSPRKPGTYSKNMFEGEHAILELIKHPRPPEDMQVTALSVEDFDPAVFKPVPASVPRQRNTKKSSDEEKPRSEQLSPETTAGANNGHENAEMGNRFDATNELGHEFVSNSAENDQDRCINEVHESNHGTCQCRDDDLFCSCGHEDNNARTETALDALTHHADAESRLLAMNIKPYADSSPGGRAQDEANPVVSEVDTMDSDSEFERLMAQLADAQAKIEGYVTTVQNQRDSIEQLKAIVKNQNQEIQDSVRKRKRAEVELESEKRLRLENWQVARPLPQRMVLAQSTVVYGTSFDLEMHLVRIEHEDRL